MSFSYLIEKIRRAEFQKLPFKHIEIEDLFSDAHFAELTRIAEIKLPTFSCDEDLVKALGENGFEPIEFPGATNSIQEYVNWHKTKSKSNRNQATCEGIGIVFRNTSPRSPIMRELNAFFSSQDFVSCIAEKFGLDLASVYPDLGIQKYLDGYEISPHPDIRKKALTYMINVNTHPNSENIEYHTHYMEFLPSRRYVMEYWKGNPHSDRCWVPWEWCRTVKRQTANNSIVMFAPSDDTMHAVKAHYDHLQTQRTQCYGNLWFKEVDIKLKPFFQDFEIKPTSRIRNDQAHKPDGPELAVLNS